MANEKQAQLGCFVSVPFSAEFEDVRRAVNAGLAMAGFRAIELLDLSPSGRTIHETLMGALASADCVIAELTSQNPIIHFELGLAQAMGKAVFPIVRRSESGYVPSNLRDMLMVLYDPTPDGMSGLTSQITKALLDFRRSPRRSQFISSGRVSTPFFIDWDRLDRSDEENLCRELLSQMGLRRVDWFKESKEIDLIAEYPRKDPDGFEYRELWLVSTGRNAPMEMILHMAGDDIDMYLRHLARGNKRFERMWSVEENIPITLLFVALGKSAYGDEFDMIREGLTGRSRKRGYPSPMRLRFWDREYLTTLVQQFPNIGYKYFSDEGRSQSKFRKGPEELYQENLALAERLTKTNADLEEEKNRRVRAERDSVWKDISFSAAHKIGNPVFAIETDLDPLEKRILEDRKDEAVEVVENIRGAVEKAKGIVDQFKSLTKAQQVQPVPTLLRPIIEDSCRILESKNVGCHVTCRDDLQVLGDPERLAEVFDELVSNALHWLDNPTKDVKVVATIADQSALPPEVDSSRKYVLVHFRDNGPGIAFENKTRIFEAFFSTYDQGTGLGLALVRRIVEGHGGAILETGYPSEGADFEIYLPLAEDSKK